MQRPKKRLTQHDDAQAEPDSPCPSQTTQPGRRRSLAEEDPHKKEGFTRLYKAYAPQIFRYFWIHTRSHSLAEDLVSETFLSALASLAGYSAAHGSFNAWLYGIARHALSAHYERLAHAADIKTDELVPLLREYPTPSEANIDLWQAVSELSQNEQEVIALKFGAGLSHREIAEIMELQETNVGVVLYRALCKLRASLADED